MLIGVHSVVVEVADLEAAVEAHARLFDRGAAFEPGGGCAFFDLGNVRLELRRRAARPARGTDRTGGALGGSDEDGLALLRLAFRADADAGGRFAAGALASPTVPLELVAATDAGSDGGTGRDTDPGGEAIARIEAGLVGLDHVVIATRDPERTRAFLAEGLGIRLALDRSFPERGLRLLFFRLGGVTLELAAALAPSPAAGRGRDEGGGPARGPGEGGDAFHGLAWKVRGLDATRARLEGAGFALSAIRPGHKSGTRVCSLRAPLCGVPTLLIEHPPRSEARSGAGPGEAGPPGW